MLIGSNVVMRWCGSVDAEKTRTYIGVAGEVLVEKKRVRLVGKASGKSMKVKALSMF